MILNFHRKKGETENETVSDKDVTNIVFGEEIKMDNLIVME